MQKVVIIGPDSYLATGLDKHLSDCQINYLYYHNWHENIKTLQQADCVINFSIAPAFSMRTVIPEEVLDIQIAQVLQQMNTHYIFISSRKVYGATNECVTHKETDTLYGFDFYAQNKIMTELKLRNILNERLTILRVSNIIGEPILRGGYKTFIGWICQSIAETGILEVTENENAVKDFITKDFLHQNLTTVIKNRLTGVYNLSAGFGIPVAKILTGYAGRDNVRFVGQHQHLKDQFILDNSKLLHDTHLTLHPQDITTYLNNCRAQLFQLTNMNLLQRVS